MPASGQLSQSREISLADMPEVLWIELTSKCPFKCLFCSRELLRGAGEHMDFTLYHRLLSELVNPRTIRLNYSGESIHYPRLIEAISLASKTGARVELVTAFSSIKTKLIEPLIRSGLDSLCISVHTLDPGHYRNIYGFGSSQALLQRLKIFRKTQDETGISKPCLEFAFVAMQRNLDQIPAVMELAQRYDVARLDIHPVIRRDPIAETFPHELDESSRLRQSFIDALRESVERSRTSYPSVHLNFSTPEIEAKRTHPDELPFACPGPLPAGANIHSCEQNPWNTAHVLANGDVVSCEVRDRRPIGNLTRDSLRSIWHGTEYDRFRNRYSLGQDSKCSTCAYKIALIPAENQQKPVPPREKADQATNRVKAKTLRITKMAVAHTATAALLFTLGLAQGLGQWVRHVRPDKRAKRPGTELADGGQGISVVIPERDSPKLLEQCLGALYRAIANCEDECEVIVIVNGSQTALYDDLRKGFPLVKWHFERRWLGFAQAIGYGLKLACFDWVFLLNNDMLLEPRALHEVYRRRAEHAFALACQIFFINKTKRREETGFTGLNPAAGLQGLYDGTPFSEVLPTSHLYAGGGASLFQKKLLSRIIEPGLYEPFYWEDVDWGIRAQQLGYQLVFVPSARAHHHHRATVSRFFPEQTIQQMFEQNALLSGLCHGWYRPPFTRLSTDLAQHRRHVFRPAGLTGMMRKRYQSGRASIRARLSDQNVVCFFPRKPTPGDKRPWLVMVSPYSVYPTSHGGAVRIDAISRALASRFRLVLVCDEGWDFKPEFSEKLDQFEAVHVLRKKRGSMAPDRLARMKGHVRPLLCQEVERALSLYRPSVVQIEYEELCALVRLKKRERWFITLHDVNRGDRYADAYLERRLRRYDAVFCCSVEDQNLLPLKSRLVENGANLSRFTSYTPSQGETLLFIGPFRYKPNRLGIEEFIRKVFPGLNRRFPLLQLNILCGDEGMQFADQFPFTHPQIALLPHSNTVDRHIREATLTINPLQNIAGSCIKTIESLASNRICVSTPNATRGLTGNGFPGLLTADSTGQFEEIIESLLADDQLRHHLERQPPGLIEEFDWNSRANSQMKAYEA